MLILREVLFLGGDLSRKYYNLFAVSFLIPFMNAESFVFSNCTCKYAVSLSHLYISYVLPTNLSNMCFPVNVLLNSIARTLKFRTKAVTIFVVFPFVE